MYLQGSEEMENRTCESIVIEHYRAVYNYCFCRLNFNSHAAEDCAQEVFLILVEKQKKLDLNGNIRLWLFRTADLVIKKYIRKNKKLLPIEADDPAFSAENTFEIRSGSSKLDALSPEELALLEDYYGDTFPSKQAVAEKHGLTLSGLYKKICIIKKAIK